MAWKNNSLRSPSATPTKKRAGVNGLITSFQTTFLSEELPRLTWSPASPSKRYKWGRALSELPKAGASVFSQNNVSPRALFLESVIQSGNDSAEFIPMLTPGAAEPSVKRKWPQMKQ